MTRRPYGRPTALVCAAAAILSAAGVAAAQDRPRVGLALSGGGARGFAHVGVLEVLEELHIPIDAVAGTSMGAVVGGLYAAGLSPAELRQVVGEIDWVSAFDDRPPRRERSFRRKQDDFGFLTNLRLYVKDWKIALPRSLIEGQQINAILAGLTLPVATVRDFDRLAIPFRAVATDATSGDPVVISGGELSRAIRASMAIPAVFSPVEVDGRLVVDGGVSKNLPIDVVREMGVDVVIAVDIGTDPADTAAVTSALSISGQMLTVLMRKNTEEQLELLTDRDVLIVPDLDGITTADFEKGPEGIERGHAAAREMADRLAPLAVGEDAFASWQAPRAAVPREPPVIDRVRVENSSPLATEIITRRLHVEPGEPLDVETLQDDLASLYGEGVFDRLTFSIDPADGGRDLVVHSVGKETGRNYMRFGLNLETNFQGESLFNLGMQLTRNPVNALGGEWRNELQVGETTRVFSEFYQPLDYGSHFFVAPEVSYEISSVNQFVGSTRVSKQRINQFRAGAALGFQPSNIGEIRVGIGYSTATTSHIVGAPQATLESSEGGVVFSRLTLDTLDDVRFPRSGGILTGTASYQPKGLANKIGFGVVSVEGLHAFTIGENTLLPALRLGTTFDDEGGALPAFRTGGFLNLSGLAPGERTGRHLLFGSLVLYRRVANPRFFTLKLPVYVGGSVELGNTFQERSEITWNRMILAGSAFVGLDTPLGPIYLAYGVAEGSRHSGYLFLGQSF